MDPPSMSYYEGDTHVVVAKWKRAWNEWCAECQCGWVGSYLPSQSRAEAEGARHVMSVTSHE